MVIARPATHLFSSLRLASATLHRPAARALSHRRFITSMNGAQTAGEMSSSSSSPLDLQTELDNQAKKVRQLKADKAPAAEVKANVDALLAIKEKMAAMGLSQATPASQPGKGKQGNTASEKAPVKFTLKTPKGTRDWDPLMMAMRTKIFETIMEVFKKHGAVTIDTPVFELKEILSGKYGEDSKLIYDLKDQGGELCSLRYDLTVPLARFLAMNPQNIKRAAIGRVYRRDQPAMSKGRFREFYQCDFDIAGQYDAMIPDSEIILIAVETLTALGIEGFTIKLNHRKILDGIFDVCGVPADKTRTISSAVDKLDKSPWEEVKREMIVEKGLEENVADEIGGYVSRKGGRDLLQFLQSDPRLSSHKTASEGIKDMELLFDYLDIYGIADRMSFDLSLARGLDYYTGIIYEAVTAASAPPAPVEKSKEKTDKVSKDKKKGEEDEVDESTIGVGSIAAGGRYDNLVGMFSDSKKLDSVPCVGISIGVERVFAIMMAKFNEQQERGEKHAVRSKDVDVFVMSIKGDGFLKERMAIAKKLWDAGIKAEYLYKNKPKLPHQFAAIERDGIPFAVIIAPEEFKDGIVRIKEQKGKDSEEGQGTGEPVKLDEMVDYIQAKLSSK